MASASGLLLLAALLRLRARRPRPIESNSYDGNISLYANGFLVRPAAALEAALAVTARRGGSIPDEGGQQALSPGAPWKSSAAFAGRRRRADPPHHR